MASIVYVDSLKSRAIVFNYLVSQRFDAGSQSPVKLKGLDPAKQYIVKEINLYPGTKSGIKEGPYSGNFLMTVGINPEVHDDRASVVLSVEQRK